MTTNTLIHQININDDKTNCLIKIKLADECKNGHEDFSITATFWEVGKYRGERTMLCGGCCHDDILKVRPDLKIFIDLHLADFRGVPMHGLANSMYHLEVGFNKIPKTDPKFKVEFCKYYMIDIKHFDKINVQDKEYYKFLFHDLGIIKEWKKYADKGIETLEKLTGNKFESKATRLSNIDLTAEEKKTVKSRIKNGYYSKENIKERELTKLKQQNEELKQKINKEIDDKIKSLNLERDVILFLIKHNINTNNFIYYNHSQTGCFNWKLYEKKITQEEFNKILTLKNLPKIKWELQKWLTDES